MYMLIYTHTLRVGPTRMIRRSRIRSSGAADSDHPAQPNPVIWRSRLRSSGPAVSVSSTRSGQCRGAKFSLLTAESSYQRVGCVRSAFGVGLVH